MRRCAIYYCNMPIVPLLMLSIFPAGNNSNIACVSKAFIIIMNLIQVIVTLDYSLG